MTGSIRQILATVHKQTGAGFKSIPVQAIEIARLYFRKGLHPWEYYAYGLASRELSRTDLDAYVSNRWYWREHVRRLASSCWTPILRNKWLFHLHYSQHGLSVPRTLGLFHGSSGITTDGKPMRNTGELQQAIVKHGVKSLVCKPVGGIGGAGILIYDRIDPGATTRCHTRTGVALSLDEIATTMLSDHKANGFLVQERVPDHPFLLRLNPYTASSIRVVTLRHADGSIHIPLAGVRFGRKGGTVDNLTQGGVSAYVNPDSGLIGRGLSRPQHLRRFVETHPDTGVQFTGEVLPCWTDVRELCTSAAKATPGIHAIGWDVLLSPDGPVLLEGNHDWELSVHQIRNKGYATLEVEDFLDSHGVQTRVSRRLHTK